MLWHAFVHAWFLVLVLCVCSRACVRAQGVVANGTLAEGLGGAPAGTFNCWGRTSNTSALPKTAEVLASFSDGAPAIVRQSIGAGKNVHFFWFPGLSHACEYAIAFSGCPVHTQ